jgi:hypothetical protein
MGATFRAKSACGVVGPLAFTGAWVACSLREEGGDGYSARNQHISGLAAPDALAHTTMTAGFLTLGASTLAFSSAVGEASRMRLAPALLRVAGVATTTAGLLRRDRKLLGPPPDDPLWRQSWRNDAHDLASGVAYACMLGAPMVVARAVDVPALEGPVAASSLISASLMGLFASSVVEPYNGILQRAAVTVSLATMAGLATALLARDG